MNLSDAQKELEENLEELKAPKFKINCGPIILNLTEKDILQLIGDLEEWKKGEAA